MIVLEADQAKIDLFIPLGTYLVGCLDCITRSKSGTKSAVLPSQVPPMQRQGLNFIPIPGLIMVFLCAILLYITGIDR